jgi:predicted AlkP superfamily phosphohydrolase/phosphomutase
VLRLLPDYCFSNTLVRFGFLVEEPYTSATFRVRPLWSVLSLQGRTAGIINWPLTYPAPAVNGYVVSDRYSRVSRTVAGLVDQSLQYPGDLRLELVRMQQEPGTELVMPARVDTVLEDRYQLPGRDDRDYRRMARMLALSRPTDVTLARYQSLDAIGHYFLRYATPSAFGDVTEAERRRFGPVLEAHYALIDDAIGRAIDDLGSQDLLLVVSGYGMEPLSLVKRIVERIIGDPSVNGTHESAPDGFLMAYGASVANGRLPRASVVDIVPTVLYFLGLPVGRDMDGYARTDLFRPEFTAERPITFIPTYDR